MVDVVAVGHHHLFVVCRLGNFRLIKEKKNNQTNKITALKNRIFSNCKKKKIQIKYQKMWGDSKQLKLLALGQGINWASILSVLYKSKYTLLLVEFCSWFFCFFGISLDKAEQ